MYLLYIGILLIGPTTTIVCRESINLKYIYIYIQDVINNNIIYISLALQDWLASSTDKVAILSKEDHISFTYLNKNTMCGQCMSYYQDGPAATADICHSGICTCTKT